MQLSENSTDASFSYVTAFLAAHNAFSEHGFNSLDQVSVLDILSWPMVSTQHNACCITDAQKDLLNKWINKI